MSWRVIFGILIVAATASAWGGLRLGDWLIANGPVAPVTEGHPELTGEAVLDADGRPYQAKPPQPLVNGRLGPPETQFQVTWEIAATPINDLLNNGRIALGTTKISVDEAVALAQMLKGSGLQGLGTLADMAVPGTEVQPIDITTPPTSSATETAEQTGQNQWQAALKRELDACSALGFFDRPSCAWAARNKYCEPNQAWGKTRDCPAKSF